MSITKPRFGVTLMPFPYLSAEKGPELRTAELFELAQLTDRTGFDSIWVTDSIARAIPRFETFSFLTALSLKTEKVKIGTAVLQIPLRHPIVLARTLATIDIFSNGRFILGAGLGWLKREFENLGVPLGERGGRTDEGLELLKRLWTESHVSYEGKYYRLTDVTIEPQPIQKPHPPVLIGGSSDAALRRAAKFNGFISSADALEGLPALIKKLRSFAEGLGKEPAQLTVAITMMTHLAPDRGKAMKEARRWYDGFGGQIIGAYPFDHLCRCGVFGTAQDYIATVKELMAAGVDTFILFLFSYDWQTQIERFHREVMPAFPPGD